MTHFPGEPGLALVQELGEVIASLHQMPQLPTFPHSPFPEYMTDLADGPQCAQVEYFTCKHSGGESYETTAYGIRIDLINTPKQQLKSHSTAKMHNQHNKD